MDSSKSFDSPRPYDVLCGRNRNSFNNIGNRRFRITISMNVEKYNSMRSRHERSKFIASLAQTMRYEVGFRFLKHKGGKSLQTVELSDDEIRAKIGHALRDLSSTMHQEGGESATPESKVPRPGPYKKQDKKALRMVSSSSSLETMSLAQSTLDDGTDADEKPAACMPTPCLTPIASSSSSSTTTTTTSAQVKSAPATIPEGDETVEKAGADAAAPEQVRSSSPPIHLMSSLFPQLEETTPLKSNLDKSNVLVSPDEPNQQHDIREVCQSLLNPPPMYLIPSLDEEDELDDFWTTSEDLQEEYAALASEITTSTSTRNYCSNTTNMSIGGGSSGCDNMSLASYLSDVMETLSLVSSS